MRKILKNNGGFTLVEIIISMAIFALLMTLTVGFFVSVQKIQGIYREIANLQQEIRIVSQVFEFQFREADGVFINNADAFSVDKGEICAAGKFLAFPTELVGASGPLALVFACKDDGAGKQSLQIGTADIPPTGITGISLTDPGTSLRRLTSSKVKVLSFRIWQATETGGELTYPRSYRYEITLDKSCAYTTPATCSPTPIHSQGYLVGKE